MRLAPITLKSLSFKDRQAELIEKISATPKGSIILASELCISGYDFDGAFARDLAGMREFVGNFNTALFDEIKASLTLDKFLAFTHITPDTTSKTKFLNQFVLLNSAEIFHTQSKSRLFLPNGESEIFSSVDESGIRIFEFLDLKVAVLICFELRFSQFWARIKGADIVLVPAMWGKARSGNFKTLCKALAVVNNCYVVACSSLDLEFAGVFLPSGKLQKMADFSSDLIVKIKENLGII